MLGQEVGHVLRTASGTEAAEVGARQKPGPTADRSKRHSYSYLEEVMVPVADHRSKGQTTTEANI